MFRQLYDFACTTRLSLLVSADPATGRLTLCVTPLAAGDGTVPQLAEPLQMCATPEEFDVDFVTALRTYTSVCVPLLEQAQQSAKALEKTASKARSAAAKRSARTGSAAAPAPAGLPRSDVDGDDVNTCTTNIGDFSNTTVPADASKVMHRPEPLPAPNAARGATQFSLFGN